MLLSFSIYVGGYPSMLLSLSIYVGGYPSMLHLAARTTHAEQHNTHLFRTYDFLILRHVQNMDTGK